MSKDKAAGTENDLHPYSIEDLEEKTGVPRRNIRYLISEGLLTEPHGQKRWARYGPEHMNALQIYADMKKEGIGSLDIIRNKIRNADNLPPLVVNEIDGVEIKIDQAVLQKLGVENLIKQINEKIRREVEKKG